MKKKLFHLLIVLSLIVLFFEVLFHKTLVMDTIRYSLEVWVQSILPSLFPFFILSDLLIRYNITNYIPKCVKKNLSRLFCVNEHVISIFFLSCLSGFPSNAKNTRTLYEEGFINRDEASYALIFTHFSNPLFILSTVAVLFFHQERYGPIILMAHFLGNILLAIFSRNPKNYVEQTEITTLKTTSFSTAFVHSIHSAIDTLLLILGTLTCFLILSSLIIQHLQLESYPAMIVKGILEITMGLKSLSLLNIADVYKVVIATMFLSFGGLSVHLQVLSQLVDTDISYLPFFVARIFHAILSGGIAYLLFFLI